MALQQQQHRFILSGGGTGGHIYPAIAIAEALKERLPGAEFLFVGAKGRMEMEKVPALGYPIKGLWISGLQRRLTPGNLLFPLKVIHSSIKAYGIISSFNPDVVIGTGGYASGPILRMAAMKGIPTLVQEQNSLPGLTNRSLARHVDRICVAYDHMEKYFPAAKIVLTGNPVRKDLTDLDGKKARGLEFFGLSDNRPVLLVVGGSLGARTLNHCVRESLDSFLEAGVQVLWQTGAAYYDEITAMVAAKERKELVVRAFIREMDVAYAAADVVVSRAGAIAISELCVAAKPCLLIPSPNVTDNHQMKNAMALAEKEAALVISDTEAPAGFYDRCMMMLHDQELQKRLSENIRKLGHPGAAGHIADEIIKLIRK